MKLITNRLNIKSKNADYTATTDDEVILCSATLTVTLPPAAQCQNKLITIKNTGTGIITIDGNGAETIDGYAQFYLVKKNDVVDIVSTGSAWEIIRHRKTPNYVQSASVDAVTITTGPFTVSAFNLTITTNDRPVNIYCESTPNTEGSFFVYVSSQTYVGLTYRLYRNGTIMQKHRYDIQVSYAFGASQPSGLVYLPLSLINLVDLNPGATTNVYALDFIPEGYLTIYEARMTVREL